MVLREFCDSCGVFIDTKADRENRVQISINVGPSSDMVTWTTDVLCKSCASKWSVPAGYFEEAAI